MPAKALTRKVQPVYRGHASHIPTTIKNPERVAHRRTELIEVATKMFLERGFHNTSIRDIVRECSFNVASLYMEEAGLATSRCNRAAPRSVHQRPVTILDFKHAERGQIEPEMILGRHVDHPAGADEALGLLDFVAHFGLVC